MCIDCNNNCLEEYPEMCVLYTGPDYDFLNIKNGNYYNKVIIQLLNKLEEIYVNPADLKTLSSKEDLNLNESLQAIIDKILILNSGDISYNGDFYCIGNDSISSSSILLLGNKLKYSISVANEGSSISYDLIDLESSLPKNFRLSRVSAVISGKPSKGKSILADSSRTSMGIKVSNDRFPVNIDIDARVLTPTGEVRLSGSVSIPTPKAGEFVSELSVRDFGTSSLKSYSLTTFNESVAMQVCNNKTRLDQLENINIASCEYINYGSKDLKSVISSQHAAICDLYQIIKNLETTGKICIEGC